MLTIKEARRLQKERSNKAILIFVFSVAFVIAASYFTLKYTDLLEWSSVFYLVPIIFLGIAIKYSKIYLFLSPKEFTGKVIKIEVYVVKGQRVKGERSYTQNEALEVAILVDNGKKTISKTMPAGDISAKLYEGIEISYLRFIENPIIINSK